MGPRAKLGKDRPTRERTPRVRSCQRSRWSADADAGGDGDDDADEERGEGEGEGVGVALEDEVGDGVVQAEGLAEVGVEDAAPVVGVLLGEWGVEAVGVAEGVDVGGGGSFAEHLDDGVAGDEVDEEEDDGDHDPEDREGDEDAAEGFPEGRGASFMLSVPCSAGFEMGLGRVQGWFLR